MTLYDRLAGLLTANFGVPAEDITPTTPFWELDLDSLDLVELTMAVEEELGIGVSEDEAENLNTLQDVVDLLQRKGASVS